MAHDHREKWFEAMINEMKSLLDNRKVKLSKGKRALKINEV